MINSYFKFPLVVATELFSAGFCNLNCTYCYIPKTKILKNFSHSLTPYLEMTYAFYCSCTLSLNPDFSHGARKFVQG